MIRVAIVMGGFSGEAPISIKSGNVVFKNLDRSKYEPYCVHILSNKWVMVTETGEEFPIDKNDFSVNYNGKKITFDVVFNAIHGSPGEDGKLAAYFEMLGIRQTSCDHYTSALTFNKRDMLSVLKPYGIKMAQSYYLNNGDPIDVDAIVQHLGLPCMVKPNRSGSSLGISMVKEASELETAIRKAFEVDREIIIESFLQGTEVSVGVMQYHDEIKVLPITEIVTENDFFDYDAKYNGESQEITPARIDEELAEKVRREARKIYRILGIKGVARSEFIIVDDVPFLLETNTVPGLAGESILPQQAAQAGISLGELFDVSLQLALKNQN